MERDLLINKLLLNIREEHMTVPEALVLAYGGGYDARKKDYNQSQEKMVIQEDSHHKKLISYESMYDARVAVKMSKTGMINAIKNKLLTRKGYYFRYETDEVDKEGEVLAGN